WPDLERNLQSGAEKSGKPFDRERLISQLTTPQYDIRTNNRVLAEMAIQTSYPFVAMAGQWGLIERDPDLAYRIAFQHLWKSTNIGSYFGLPFLQCVTNAVEPRLFRLAFSSVALSEASDRRGPPVVITQISVNNLLEWLFSADGTNCSVTIEAVVVERLMSVKDQLSAGELAGIQTHLNRFRDCPGTPLAIYLLHSEIEKPSLAPLLRNVLEEPTVNRTLKEMLLNKYAQDVRHSFDFDTLKASATEKRRYKEYVERHSK
ncbi:MAG TPA: hypothetical protein PLX89_27950, partial [Verrucomicrobiota bacterium]|nr:hypothetical protein [Verrucomicrobiota bacterium]